jgi:hypothetical protein
MRKVAPAIVIVLVVVAAVVVLGWLFASASLDARDAAHDGVFPRELLGLPILEGFRTDGRFGIHLQPGALVFVIVPVVTAVVVSLPGLRRFVRGNA